MARETQVGGLARELLTECEEAWWAGSSALPDVGRTFSRAEQQARERELVHLVDQLLAELRNPPTSAGERESVERRLTLSGRAFARSSLGVDDAHMDLLLQGGFTPCAREFAQRARRFAPAMSFEDIVQASRNIWTVNGLQMMLGLPLRVTPSAFGYSMLYPYTDNLLDDPAISEEEKSRVNERFGRRVCGDALEPESDHERALWALFAEIESEHIRAAAPRVYESLEVIHRAQTRSVLLMRRDEPPYAIDVLGISLEKGGASVLADGYLVGSDLTRSQAGLFFGLGALLQLADDLQDVNEDARSGTLTVFSQAARRWPLDRLTNRLLQFRAFVLARRPDDAPGVAQLGDLMRGASLQLTLGAVGAAPELFTREYVRRIESFSPFRFRALVRQRARLERHQVSFLGLAASALEGAGAA